MHPQDRPCRRPQLHQRAAGLEGARPRHLVKTFKLSKLSRRCAMSVSISIRRTRRWFSRSTRRAGARPARLRSRRAEPAPWHDYKRHGTTTLFGARRPFGHCMKRHRHQEWLKFLRRIDAETPKKLDASDHNYATHKPWLAKHPRHFTPTSASWLSQVERFFGLITSDQIRCGEERRRTRNSLQEYLEHHNADPKPFVWRPPYSKKSLGATGVSAMLDANKSP